MADHDHHRVTVIALGVAPWGRGEETTAERVDAGDEHRRSGPTYFTGSIGSSAVRPASGQLASSWPGDCRRVASWPRPHADGSSASPRVGVYREARARAARDQRVLLFKLAAPSSTRLLGVAAAPMGSTLSACMATETGSQTRRPRTRWRGAHLAGDFDQIVSIRERVAAETGGRQRRTRAVNQGDASVTWTCERELREESRGGSVAFCAEIHGTMGCIVSVSMCAKTESMRPGCGFTNS